MLGLIHFLLIILGLSQGKKTTAFIYTSDILSEAKISFDDRLEMSQFWCHRVRQLQTRCINRQDVQIQIRVSFNFKMPFLQIININSMDEMLHQVMSYVFIQYVCCPHRVGHNEIIGVMRVGCNAEGLGRDHWNEMLAYPRKPIAHWHPLLESKKSEKEVGLSTVHVLYLGLEIKTERVTLESQFETSASEVLEGGGCR